MNRQEILEKVIRALALQGARSLGKRDGAAADTCFYRGLDGLKCAIGHLIPDEEYHPSMEGRGIFRLIDAFEDRPSIAAMIGSESILGELQVFHDSAGPWKGRDRFIEHAKDLCDITGLDSSFLGTLEFGGPLSKNEVAC